MVLNRNGVVNGGKFDWREAVIDSAVASGFTFFSSLGGVTLAGGNLQQAFFTALIASGTQFFGWLMVKRGLKKEVKK